MVDSFKLANQCTFSCNYVRLAGIQHGQHLVGIPKKDLWRLTSCQFHHNPQMDAISRNIWSIWYVSLKIWECFEVSLWGPWLPQHRPSPNLVLTRKIQVVSTNWTFMTPKNHPKVKMYQSAFYYVLTVFLFSTGNSPRPTGFCWLSLLNESLIGKGWSLQKCLPKVANHNS